MTRTIGVGIIGTGYAERVQMPGFGHAPAARLVAVASGRRESAERAASKFSIPRVCDGFEELVTLPEVDLVVISSPPHAHAPAAIAAARNGKHILCEKPTALDLDEALAMQEAAERAGVLNLIDHELRFSPNRRRARDLIRNGAVGEVRHVTAVYRSGFGLHKTHDWWYTAAAGGGILGAIGSHVVDTLRWWIGDVEAVDCRLRTFIGERPDRATGEPRPVEVDDFASMRLATAGGATAEISLSSLDPGPPQHRFEVVGSEATLVLDDEASTLTRLRAGEREDLSLRDPSRGLEGVLDNVWAPAFVNFAREIVDALLEGRTEVAGAATFRDGARVQAVLDAARRSNASGAVERLEL